MYQQQNGPENHLLDIIVYELEVCGSMACAYLLKHANLFKADLIKDPPKNIDPYWLDFVLSVRLMTQSESYTTLF